MNIYIWDNLDMTTYYRNGVAIVLANNIREARKIAKAQVGKRFENLINKQRPEVLRTTKRKKSVLIHYFSGND